MQTLDTATNIPFVDLKAQYDSIKAEIDAAMASVLETTAFVGGPFVKDFEQAFARYCGTNECVGLANGTDALFIALKSLGVGAGDEVITAANSFVATSEAINMAGAQVVFVDINPRTFTIDVDRIEEKITAKTKAIIPVHLYGQPADMHPIRSLARKHGLFVVGDAAQAHGAQYDGQPISKLADITCFSFYPGKNLGAYGDAGCVVTNDDRLAEWMTTFARHGGKGDHVMEGINSRLDGLQAAILNAKLPYLSAWTEARRCVASCYNELLEDVGDVITPKTGPGREHVYHLYVIRTENRDALREYLTEAGISTGLNYPRALPFYPAYAHLGYIPKDFPVAWFNQSRILSLPMYPEMTKEMITQIVECIASFFKEFQEPDSIPAKVIQFAERC